MGWSRSRATDYQQDDWRRKPGKSEGNCKGKISNAGHAARRQQAFNAQYAAFLKKSEQSFVNFYLQKNSIFIGECQEKSTVFSSWYELTQRQILKWNSYKYNNKLCRDTDGRSGDDESSKPADTGLVTNLEQEPVIANNKIICHAGKNQLPLAVERFIK